MKKILFCLAIASFAACTTTTSQTPTTTTTTSRDPLPQLQRSTAALLSTNEALAQSINQAPTKNKIYTQMANAAVKVDYLAAKFCKDANTSGDPANLYSLLCSDIEAQLNTITNDVTQSYHTLRQPKAEALIEKSPFGKQRPKLLSNKDFQVLSANERAVYVALLQADAAAGANEILLLLAKETDNTDIKLTDFTILSQPQKPAVLLGETFKTDVALGAYSTRAQYKISVDGTALATKDGVSTHNALADKVGTQTYIVTATVVNPMTGEEVRYTKIFDYEVIIPSVVVAVENSNILYLNEENLITIAAAGISSNDLSVQAEGAELISKGRAQYTIIPTKLGKVNITLTNKANSRSFGPFAFEVKKR